MTHKKRRSSRISGGSNTSRGRKIADARKSVLRGTNLDVGFDQLIDKYSPPKNGYGNFNARI
jgi:hypothetical protein